MANFTPELFIEIARTADSNNRFLREEENRLSISFDDADKAIISEFKDAIFTVIMLRAAESLKAQQQQAVSSDLPHAHTYFAMTLFDKDVHPKKDIDYGAVKVIQENLTEIARKECPLETDSSLAKFIMSLSCIAPSGPITFRTLRAHKDDENEIIHEIMNKFDDFTMQLTCN